MIEISEKAAQYAEGKMNEVLTNALVLAYSDGFRDGYKTREEEIPIDLRDDKTEYVDLGLPSGTLWAKDYEKEGDSILSDPLFLPYDKAKRLNIPSVEQWLELKEVCKWEFWINDNIWFREATCVGPNGNTLKFTPTGKKNIENTSGHGNVFFWLKDNKDGNDKNAVHLYYKPEEMMYVVEDFFSGYKLPVRLVRTQ